MSDDVPCPMNDTLITALVVSMGSVATAAVTGTFALLVAQRKVVKSQGEKIDQIHGLVNSKMEEALREIIALKGVSNHQDATIATMVDTAAKIEAREHPT
jgi:hypothetical protein